ncbi:MAG: 4-hydroxy-tetrahydrodipicolinate reductase [Campylobacter sp.]|nr:4-hydroxy-tetrahydrodipicolinate reductase [Campylobacter sp.]
MLKVGIHGASGKMGKTLIECLKNYENTTLSAIYSADEFEIKDSGVINAKTLDELFNASDIVIDFSVKDGAIKLLEFAKTSPKLLCIGTTGLGDDGDKLLKECAKSMPILYATNMSLGVAIANKLVQIASKALRDFDIEITEMHHKHKKDAPSGTALTLATTAANARDLDLKSVMVSSRDGFVGERKKDEIGVFALRGGNIVGRHEVGFYGDGEFVQVTHTATSRATFANGAIKAAIWLSEQKNGLYGINDCLGL